MELSELEAIAGVEFWPAQAEAILATKQQDAPARRCLYFPTGKGKTITSLSCLRIRGHEEVLVVAPPITHSTWVETGAKLGMVVDTVSAEKFRRKDYKLLRTKPIIVDEFHLLGGHGAMGWKKLSAAARRGQFDMLILSATPNYNDAERVYCVQHVLDPTGTKGGYLQFIYRNCKTKHNPFGATPDVLGFLHHKDAANYLSALPLVSYIPDEVVYTIQDISVAYPLGDDYEKYGINYRSGRMIASQMEDRHARINLALIDEDGFLRGHVFDVLAEQVGLSKTPVLIFAAHATVATALANTLALERVEYAILTGGSSLDEKNKQVKRFCDGELDVLIGTATLATGTDGIDKVCDKLIILDDTDDDAKRRQLIGRIMPRGKGGSPMEAKEIVRFTL